jgi:thymidylate synthase
MVRERKLSYQFMAAEAFWILSGDDTVAGIAPWNQAISKFSDNGVEFFGAYGPKIAGQLDYVVNTLVNDPDSRQAGLTIWRENPPQTRDVPCTIAVFFSIRGGKLHASVFMRSSDAWLGLPYDVFNFSMLSHLVCCRLNHALNLTPTEGVTPGDLHLMMASSHLYARDLDHVELCLAPSIITPSSNPTPDIFCRNEHYLMSQLKALRDSKPGTQERWWEDARNG